jgi:hypothetical protein
MLFFQDNSRFEGMRPIANGILFQLNWFVCIFLPEVALYTTALLLLVHDRYFVKSVKEWQVIICFALFGFSFDLGLGVLGLLNFETFPLWLLCLWLSFATCLNHALQFFHSRVALLLLLSCFSIPLNYAIGASYSNTLIMGPTWLVLSVITIFWLLLLVAVMPVIKKVGLDYA